MMMKYTLCFLVFTMATFTSFSQQQEEKPAGQYLSIQTGFVISDVNALGTNLFAEYQRSIDKKRKGIYSISLDYTQSISDRYRIVTDMDNRKANTVNLSGNIYYVIGKPDKVFNVMPGFGFGLTFIAASQNAYFKPTFNFSLTMAFKLSGRVYLQLSPAVIWGNRFYFNPFKEGKNNGFGSINFIPVGVRIKL